MNILTENWEKSARKRRTNINNNNNMNRDAKTISSWSLEIIVLFFVSLLVVVTVENKYEELCVIVLCTSSGG